MLTCIFKTQINKLMIKFFLRTCIFNYVKVYEFIFAMQNLFIISFFSSLSMTIKNMITIKSTSFNY